MGKRGNVEPREPRLQWDRAGPAESMFGRRLLAEDRLHAEDRRSLAGPAADLGCQRGEPLKLGGRRFGLKLLEAWPGSVAFNYGPESTRPARFLEYPVQQRLTRHTDIGFRGQVDDR